ncbi:fibronectin-binding protein A N-terminus-domain-containing protein [Pyronema omphalodes]|nr:fibronectin-binding protein A N-terminus-domain-containing protein [Pyronema omphalodes]
MKQRFSSLDLQIISHEISTTLVGYRLSNVYDLTSRIFLLRFAKPDSKHLVVIDSGFRVHLTSFTRETSPTPSSFTSKLRKYLRTRRLTAVEQLGVDRILRLTFSDGLYYLFLEFFAGGNVILTDGEMTQLAVLRLVPANEDGTGECRVGAKYDATGKPRGEVSRERIVTALKDAVEDGKTTDEPADAPKQPAKKFQKKKKKVDTALKRVLGARMSEFSPTLIEHALLGVGVDPGLKAEQVLADEELLEKVFAAFNEAAEIIRDLTTEGSIKKGYIIAKKPSETVPTGKKDEAKEKKAVAFGAFGSTEAVESEKQQEVQEEGEAKGLVFDDFHPFLPRQFINVPGVKTLEYEGFNKTVDTFYSSIEAQKLESRLKEREIAAKKRLESARMEHQKRVEGLRDVQDLNIRKASTLELNSSRVEEAIAAVNGLIAQGMDWVQIARLIENEQKRGNAVAELIQLPLKLDQNKITLKLREVDFDDEDEEEADKFDGFSDDEDEDEGEAEDEKESGDKPSKAPLKIDVDLSLTSYANARSYYDEKRSAAEKEVKTLKSSEKALKSTERKVQADLKKGLKNEKQLLRPVRQPLWFEKFLFFVSSDGYLVLGGRDAMQNEYLYKRHFKRGDIYLHADIDGATSVIVKNNPATPNAPIPPSTLQQAGTLAVATSTAWDSKAGMSAWWVAFEQVSKTGLTGEYLAPGVFNIKGNKNFLPPAQLVLGYGVLWRIDEESKKRHMKHRIEQPQEGSLKTEDVEEQKDDPISTQEEVKDDSDDEEFPDFEIPESTSAAEPSAKSDDEDFPDVEIPEPTAPQREADSEEEDFPDVAIPEQEAEEKTASEEDEASEAEADQPGHSEPRPTPASSTPAAPGTPITGRKHLTAKQRRDLKKGKTISDPVTPSEPSRSSTPAPSVASTQKAPAALARGKRTKEKRAAQKYAHQSEEDRQLALAVLGVAKPVATSEVKQEAPKETPEARKLRLREQHLRAQEKGMAEEAKRLEALEAGENDDDEDAIRDTPLDALIADPFDDDVILDAIPVCAPWGAMGKYKWRVKIQPGAQKKGKAIREVWGGWVNPGKKGDGMKGVQKELVAAWKESELVSCVGVSKIKVFSSGGGAGKGDGEKKKGAPQKGAKRGKGSKR